MGWFEGYDARRHAVNGVRLFVRTGGPVAPGGGLDDTADALGRGFV